MENRRFWNLFAETGEPLYWLLSRAQERLPRAEKRKIAPEAPSPRKPDSQPKL